MKIIKKILALMITFGILLQNVVSLAGVIDIGDESIIERGDLGFYSIQYWFEAKQDWRYITYSRTYYIDKDGNKRVAYCVNPELDGVGWLPGEVENCGASITEKISDNQLWRVYKNGYPNVTPAEMKVETEDDAYLATKQAAYFILKGKSAKEVYSYFRAGETQINGQNLEETQRRGKKVVDAIYRLVNIGQNGSENIPTNLVSEVIDPNKLVSEKYVTVEFYAEGGCSGSYSINDIINAPEGSFMADRNGNPKSTFSNGEYFNLMIPKEKINGDFGIAITYSRNSECYPVFYAKSKTENTQNYVVITEKEEKEDGFFGTYISGNKSEIIISKIDEETKEKIPGVKFNIKYEDDTDVGEYTTDKNGEIKIQNLKQGMLDITEKETVDGYELDDEIKTVKIEYDSKYNIEITNKHKKGSLEIEKVDKDDNAIKLEGVEFDVINLNGEEIGHLVTDENGKAELLNINTGEYILKETKTNEDYKIQEDKNIIINWNEKIGVTVENEKKKGSLKIIKEDSENEEIKLSNVEFNLYNESKEKIGTYKTDENGEISINNLPIGTYVIKEVKTLDNYVLNDEESKIKIEDGKESTIIMKNKKIKGQIEITKLSDDANNILHTVANTPIENVKFEIYNKSGKLVDTIVTNESGIAKTTLLEKGIYKIKEIEAGKWYVLNDEIFEAEIKENDEIVKLEIKNKSEDPKLDIEKTGPEVANINQEIKYDFTIKNTGNVKLDKFVWYDFLPYESAKITKIATGTYNQKVIYNVLYKTNKKTEYAVLETKLDSQTNNYINVSNVFLDEDESITEIKFNFESVDVEFKSVEKPEIYMKVVDDINDGFEFKNETILEGYHLNYKVSDEASVITKISNKPVLTKKLPRTGF